MKKFLIVSLLVSFSAFGNCFTKQNDVQLRVLKAPESICITNFKAELLAFGESKATFTFVKDGVISTKTAKLKGQSAPYGYTITFTADSDNYQGGVCDETESITYTVSANVTSLGKLISITSLKGQTSYSWDWCHGPNDYDTIVYK